MAHWSSLFDAQLEVGPPLSDQQLLSIPAKRGVLLMLAEGDRPIGLLTAADIRARLRNRLATPEPQERKKTADLREITRKILWKLSPNHFETDLNYFELARQIWPGSYQELLAWRPGWFVHVNAAEPFPHFTRTREAGRAAGLYVGPFENGRSADKFIETVEDAFDLCRDYSCLRQSPNGPPCAYLQMGRCVGPCNGTISLEEYRKIVAQAAELAAGDHRTLRSELQRRMGAAAAELQFEKASALKARLARLDELDKSSYQQVAPLSEFRFILVQPLSTKQAQVFLVRGPLVVRAAPLDCPPQEAQLSPLLASMQAPLPQVPIDEAGLWRMGLVCHYLFSGNDRRGVIIRYSPSLSVQNLVREIDASAENLRLRKPKAPPP